MHSYARTVNTLAEGVELVLRGNPDLINRPESFYGALLDVYDHEQRTPEMQVMGQCLDSCMLKPFAAVTAHQGADVSEQLENAKCQAANTLIQDCYISEDIARSVAQQLAAGVSRYIGVATTPAIFPSDPTTARTSPPHVIQNGQSKTGHQRFEPEVVAEPPTIPRLVLVFVVLLAALMGGVGTFLLLSKATAPGNTNLTLDYPPSTSNALFTMSQLPRTWRGTYEGYSEYTKDHSIERKVSISLTHVEENGELTATCSIGVEEDADGATHGTYEAKGSVDWDDGSIWLVGTRWLDQGGLLGMGGYKGAIDPNTWTIEGRWYDPEGEVSDGSWYMTAM